MNRVIRRSEQSLSMDDNMAVLNRCSSGIMACHGDEDYPYAVPLNYVNCEGKIYFHSAKAGHKIDAIARNPKVSFTVIDQDEVVSKEYTSYFRSVIVFGTARITKSEEWEKGFQALVEKYSGDRPEEEKRKEISGCQRSHIIAIDIDHVAGKEAKELAHARKV